ncbi:FtsK/SpoIIIE domain-containing protein [Aeromicrobium sp. P5_D10]
MTEYSIWTELGFSGNPYDQNYLAGTEQGAALFCGRTSELARVQMSIGSGGTHVSIEGDAGVGKTSLAQVAAFEMFRRGRQAANGTLFVPVTTPLQLSSDPVDFELQVWRSIAHSLLINEQAIRSAGLNMPDLSGLGDWLQSPTTLTTGSASILGFGAGAGRGMNTSSGFGESGFTALVRRALEELFPTAAAGGIVCILDNLELLGTSEAARHSLETIRSNLLEVPAIRWVLVGSNGIVSSARSRRLSGFIDAPIRLQPLTEEESVELVRRRLEYWGTERAHPPVQPGDFQYLYRALGLNLRDSLALAQQFAKYYHHEFVGTSAILPADEERPLYFQAWLAEQADLILADVVGVPADSWRLFDRMCEGAGAVTLESGDDEQLRLIAPLRDAHLLDVESVPTQAGALIASVTNDGWLCASARARAFAQAEGIRAETPMALPVPASQLPSPDAPELNELPDSCRLADVVGFDPFSPAAVAARWVDTPRSTQAVVGVCATGLFTIDLRRDGPHALIAGTTGSGKSELLQSMIASLALENRPDALNFVLVDYKGGSAFKACAGLPHTVALVTDLDRHLTRRALTSLGAELHRRERLLAGAGAKDFEDYIERQPHSGDAFPLLVIVVDEFAHLAKELPEFVTGLVGVAQRGRSLGVHLVLATQRPSGVVSPEIRANTNVRISLRLSDQTESTDVLEAPDAAMIPRALPGRGFARTGAGPLIGFQVARVGGRVLAAHGVPESERATDLSLLVDAVSKAHAALGETPLSMPWLPPLAETVLLDDLLVEAPAAGGLPLVPYALEDLPADQARRVAAIDLDNFLHLGVIGGPQSGKSRSLQTIAGSLATYTSPADVHVYGLDGGNGALLPLTELPHCGAVVTRSETQRLRGLAAYLAAELQRRHYLLRTGGFASVREQRSAAPSGERLPHIVLLIDGWEGFAGEQTSIDGTMPAIVKLLLRQGAAAGIHVIVTGGRRLLDVEMRALLADQIALRLADHADYAFLDLAFRDVPEVMVPGRGFRSGARIELQMASLTAEPENHAHSAQVRRLGEAARVKYAHLEESVRPRRIVDREP